MSKSGLFCLVSSAISHVARDTKSVVMVKGSLREAGFTFGAVEAVSRTAACRWWIREQLQCKRTPETSSSSR